MLHFLKKPYPVILNRWRLAISIGLFISFFLSVFQPFGLQFVENEYKSFILPGYGLVTFLVLLFDLFLLPQIFTRFFKEENWTIGRQISYLFLIVLTISIANYVYSAQLEIVHWVGLRGLLIFILFTSSIALLPIVIITIITQNIHLKRNLHLSERINESIEKKSTGEHLIDAISIHSGTQEYHFLVQEIIFMESEGNYVNIHTKTEGSIQRTLIRKTLKEICISLENPALFRCHRAFVVNLEYIEKVKGNSHGILLSLAHTSDQIPVSRNHTKSFSERMAAIQKPG